MDRGGLPKVRERDIWTQFQSGKKIFANERDRERTNIW